MELMSFGFFAIIKESFKIIFSWKKIFSQIAVSLILPLTLIFLAQIQQFGKIIESDRIVLYHIINIAFFILTLIFSLLSTAAVIYTIDSIYTSKPVTYKKIMTVVPRVWKRLMVTFLWGFFIVFLFNSFSGVVFYACWVFLGFSPVGIFAFIVILILFLAGSIYISVVWNVANAVSVLEEDRGYKAFVKAKELVKGKLGISLAIFFIISVFTGWVLIVYQMFYEHWFVGVACLVFLMFMVLFELVVQTVIYLVCKSYHHERINRPALADHLDTYCGNDDLKKGLLMDQV